MDDIRLGSAIRQARIRRGWRQVDLGRQARISATVISRVERGHCGSIRVSALRRICAALDIRLDLVPRWRGGDLDRMLSGRHSLLNEAVARAIIARLPVWEITPEVSFSIWGERGVIDLLLWHPGRRALLVIELKTDIVDVGEMLGTLDRKRRLAAQIARERGWDPVTVSAWIIVTRSRTTERRIREFRTMIRAAYPADGRAMRRWLRDPIGPIAALSTWPVEASARHGSGSKRVRRRGRPTHETPPKQPRPDRTAANPEHIRGSPRTG